MSVSDAAILRISDEKTLELVELYKKEECLWNTGSLDYRILMKRKMAAENIARILNIPNFEARHVMVKFKNLRNAFCQELKKTAAMAKNLNLDEIARGRKAKPKAQWYAVMDSFIRPHLQANYSTSGPTLVINGGIIKREPEPEPEDPLEDPEEIWENSASENLSTDVPRPVEESDDSVDMTEAFRRIADKTKPTTAVENENENNKRAASNSRSSTPKRMRSEDILAESLKEVSTQLSQLKDDLANNKAQKAQMEEKAQKVEKAQKEVIAQKEDFHDHFGKYVSSLLRLLPMRKALLLQPKIVNIIAKEVLGEQEEIEEIEDC